MKDLNCNVISLDWQTHPLHAKIFMANKTLQGNLDPCVLYSSKKRIKEETIKMLNQYQGIPHIANLGQWDLSRYFSRSREVFYRRSEEIRCSVKS